MKNQTYIRCPRCELNYILKKDKFCNVCKMEMKALGSQGAEENLDLELCHVCKTNYISPDEDMCVACRREKELEDEEGKENDSIWNTYTSVDDDTDEYDGKDEDELVPLSGLDDTGIEEDDDLELGLGDDNSADLDDDELEKLNLDDYDEYDNNDDYEESDEEDDD